jgi:tol-pal system protein YbgF
MIRSPFRTAAVVLTVLAGAPMSVPPAAAQQMDDSDIVVQLDRMQNQMRQMTGQLEQLQFRNQQLEQQLKRMQEDYEFRFQELSRGGARPQAQRPAPAQQPLNQPGQLPPPQQAAPSQGRGDAFDPAANPNAPGVPRQLGAPGRRSEVAPPVGQTARNDAIGTTIMTEEQVGGGAVGVPGGREPGQPLDLSNMPRTASAGENYQGGYPQQGSYPQPNAYPQNSAIQQGGVLPPPAQQQAAPQRTAALTPAQRTRDEYDAAYGFMLRKDYASAEQNLKAFIASHPRDKLAGEAQFWIGESLFQRQNYREAADAFVVMTKKYEHSSKAPDALLRLGQSLAALKEKDLACATFSEVGRKYPRASQSVKQTVERELKRVKCS